jgi:hypothetical protein
MACGGQHVQEIGGKAMIATGNVATVACARGTETAFPSSSLIRHFNISNWECENLTARTSHNRHTMFAAAAVFLNRSIGHSSWRRLAEQGAQNA